MNDVKTLWDELKSTPCPASDSHQSKLNEVDRSVAGCVQVYISNGGVLAAGQKATLGRCMQTLREINPGLNGDAQVYFGKLYRLCDLVYNRA